MQNRDARYNNFTWERVNDKTWLLSAHAQPTSSLAQVLPMATGRSGLNFVKSIFWGVLNTAVPTSAAQTFLWLVTQSFLAIRRKDCVTFANLVRVFPILRPGVIFFRQPIVGRSLITDSRSLYMGAPFIELHLLSEERLRLFPKAIKLVV